MGKRKLQIDCLEKILYEEKKTHPKGKGGQGWCLTFDAVYISSGRAARDIIKGIKATDFLLHGAQLTRETKTERWYTKNGGRSKAIMDYLSIFPPNTVNLRDTNGEVTAIENAKNKRDMRKPTFWFPTRSDTNQAAQLQKTARGLKFRI